MKSNPKLGFILSDSESPHFVEDGLNSTMRTYNYYGWLIENIDRQPPCKRQIAEYQLWKTILLEYAVVDLCTWVRNMNSDAQ